MNFVAAHLLEDVDDTSSVLGGGYYAKVSRGRWKGCDVAIKRLHPMFMGLDRDNQPREEFRRFLEEFKMLKRLSHPHIVQVYGLVEPASRDGCHGVVMELFPFSLKERYSRNPELTVPEEVGILFCVASGVEYLHSSNILHRDVTTSNVMCTGTSPGSTIGLAKLVDLGVARAIASGSGDELSLTMTPGCERYMAPETFNSPKSPHGQTAHYGRPADVYSIAVTGVAMLNKREPPPALQTLLGGRDQDLTELDKCHPAYRYVVACIAESPDIRPTSSQLSSDLRVSYEECLQTSARAAEAEESELKRLKEENDCLVQERDLLATRCGRIVRESDDLLASANQEIARLRQQLTTQRKSSAAEVSASALTSQAASFSTGAVHLDLMMREIITDSQRAPQAALWGLIATDKGVLARCQRLFAVDGVPPTLSQSPKVNQLACMQCLDSYEPLSSHDVSNIGQVSLRFSPEIERFIGTPLST